MATGKPAAKGGEAGAVVAERERRQAQAVQVGSDGFAGEVRHQAGRGFRQKGADRGIQAAHGALGTAGALFVADKGLQGVGKRGCRQADGAMGKKIPDGRQERHAVQELAGGKILRPHFLIHDQADRAHDFGLRQEFAVVGLGLFGVFEVAGNGLPIGSRENDAVRRPGVTGSIEFR